VGRKDHCPLCFVRQATQQAHDLNPSRQIEEGGRLIKRHDQRFLRQGTCHHHPLPFAVAQFVHQSSRQVDRIDRRERLMHDLFIVWCQASSPVGMRVTPQGNQRVDSQLPDLDALGQHHAHTAGNLTGAQRGEIDAIEPYPSIQWRLHPHQRAQQG
jgi:hypothetical protein